MTFCVLYESNTHANTWALHRLSGHFSVHSVSGSRFSLRDVDVFRGGEGPSLQLLAEDCVGCVVREFPGGVGFGVSSHQLRAAGLLPNRRGVARTPQFPVLCRCSVLDRLRNSAAGGISRGLSPDRGSALRRGITERLLRRPQREFDEGSENYGPAGELAGSLARAQGRAHQRDRKST